MKICLMPDLETEFIGEQSLANQRPQLDDEDLWILRIRGMGM